MVVGWAGCVCVCAAKTVSRCASARSMSASRRSSAASASADDELPLPHPVHRHVDVVAAAGDAEPARDVVAARLDRADARRRRTGLRTHGRTAATSTSDKRDGVEARRASARASAALTMSCCAQHHQVRVVNRDERREEESLRVLEVLAQHSRDVFGIERHQTSEAACQTTPRAGSVLSATRRAGAAASSVAAGASSSRHAFHRLRAERDRNADELLSPRDEEGDLVAGVGTARACCPADRRARGSRRSPESRRRR